ncbi:hypothetical protein HZS_6087, partial [Henneguya salminicola]
MAFSIPKASYNSMMKEGTRNFQGLEEAVYRNIEACKRLASIPRSSYGPNGMQKIVLNHLEKLFVTKDAATIVKELEVEHPAAKIIVMAAKMAEQEVGDGTNFVIQFASSLMSGAGDLLNFGVTPYEIIDGYNLSLKKACEILHSHVCSEIKDLHNIDQVSEPIKSAITTKQTMYSDHISKLVTKACLMAQPLQDKVFNVENVRTVKILGGSGALSEVSRGLVIKTEVQGTVLEVKNAKIVVYNTDFDLMNTETKGTVLLNTANELLSFTKGEESAIKQVVSDLKAVGCNVVICSGKIADQALDYSNREGIMVIRVSSKFELQRLCRATMSVSLATMVIPNPEQMGHCDNVYVKEIGDTNVVVFEQEREDSGFATIIIRGSSENVLDDIDRAVDDGVNCYKSLSIDGCLIPGAGAIEMALCTELEQFSSECTGLESHAISKFCDALKDTVRCIAENNGLKVNEVLSKLYGDHTAGKSNMGIDIDSSSSTCDVTSHGIYDLLRVKIRCLQLAVDAATTLLSVDQIIVARPAGGP